MNIDFSYMITPQYIYMKKSKAEKKELELMITNFSNEAVTMKNPNGLSADDYPEYDEELKEKNPDGFYVFFHYGNSSGDLTTKENAAAITVGVSSPDWDVSWVKESEKIGAYWIIAPKKTVTIAAHDSISIQISDIYCNGIAGETPLHVDLRAGGKAFCSRVSVYKMFQLDYDLSCKVLSGYLTVDNEEHFQVEITNFSSSPLVFENPHKLPPEEYPKYDDFASENSAAGFYLYFYYGNEGGDLVTKEDSVNYSVNVENNPKWKVGYGDSPTVGRYWRICPVENTTMNSHETLELRIDKLKTNQKNGLTLLNMELRADGKILPDKQDIMKLKKPMIQSFTPEKEDCDINETVTFHWEVEDGDGCSAMISSNSGVTDVTGMEKCDMKMIDSSFTLTVKNMAGYSVSKSYTPKFSFITCFQAVDCDGESVTLKWETRNGRKCEIQWEGGKKEVELSGETKISAKKGSADEFRFSLVLTQKDSVEEHTAELTFGYARITEFQRGTRYYSCLQEVSRNLSEKNPFVTLEEVQGVPITPIVILPYDGGGGYDPKDPHDVVEWDGKYVDYYMLNGKDRYSGDSSHWKGYPKGEKCTLRAYSLGGKVYDERTI